MGLVLKNSLCADKQSQMVQIYCVESPKFGTCQWVLGTYIPPDLVKTAWCITGKIKNSGIHYKIIGLVDLTEHNAAVKAII